MKWIAKGDWDGFFGLGLNNFVNLLLIINLSTFVLGFSPEFVATRVLPGLGMGLIFGNVFYAWQAKSLATRTNRNDVCALPYGINLLPIFFFTFYVMAPAQQIALSNGASKEEADHIAWMAGVVACFGSGLIEVVGAFFVHHLRKVAARAALLSALASVGLFFIAADYAFRSYAFPLVGLSTLFLVLYFYYGSVTIKWRIPGGLIVLIFGIAIAWISHAFGMESPVASLSESSIPLGLYLPLPYGLEAFASPERLLGFAAVMIPMGLMNVVGSMQALESAAAAGDSFAPRSSLIVNGLGTLVAGGLGAPFPTTLFIGHAGWKEIGARSGYSLINGVVMGVLCFSGLIGFLSSYVPIEAGMAILIWIGITIGTQAFAAVPKRHIPAVAVGLIPGIGAFAALVAKRVLSGAGYGAEGIPYSSELLNHLAIEGGFFAKGVFALEQGWLYASIVLASIMVAFIDRKFSAALSWLGTAAVLSALGILHNFQVLDTDITTGLGPVWGTVAGYASAILVLVLVKVFLIEKEPVVAAKVEKATGEDRSSVILAKGNVETT
ncbi:NCS2 family permease [Pelagicoccus albus]|uniref:NCS2 family permease n=1 Tax=Pelagicoccus albus TaxID=415222 RepID=A0A7X1E9R0_9BACT|nr:NCS2 family permease [Pelagicoccus albus]MBC2607699.1 NCS2 family permease [Pelagicoccus albus]